MGKKQKNKPLEKDEPQQYTFSDEVLRKKIKRHIEDIKDVITDEDIARAKIPGEESPPVKRRKQNDQQEDAQPERAGEGKPITPWDIID